MGAAGLYIHIPFCRSKCPYCGFYSTTELDALPEFLKALPQEMDLCRNDSTCFDTIYIGGGTPSLLSIQELGCILESATKKFHLQSPLEITLEANPADCSLPWLRALRTLGINRISIGVQSFDDQILTFLGRRHNRGQAIYALGAANQAGFDGVGLDLVYGIPGQGLSDWIETLSLARSFRPAHLSCYQLTIEPGTPLGERHDRKEISLPDEDALADLFFTTSEYLQGEGYCHYEVSNFSRTRRHRSRHNQKYWDHTPYLGLGPAAHSFSDRKRHWNHRDLGRYLHDVTQGIAPVAEAEELTEEQLRMEALFLGLRTAKGIHLKRYATRYGCDLLVDKGRVIAKLVEEGMIKIRQGYLRPTVAGLAMADALALI